MSAALRRDGLRARAVLEVLAILGAGVTVSALRELGGVDALVLPVWTFPPVLLGDRGQSPQGGMTFIASALQWPVVVVPMGFVGEQLPMGMQLLGRPWTEGQLIRLAYAFEQATGHRQAPASTAC